MQLTDGDRIRGLLGTYCRLVDTADFAGVGALMEAAVLRGEDGTVMAAGAEEVTAMYTRLVRVHEDGTPGTQHVVANTVFEEPHADGSVRATSTYLVFQAIPSLALQPIITGTYVDTFVQDGGTWRFGERRFSINQAGLLEQHLLVDMTRLRGGS